MNLFTCQWVFCLPAFLTPIEKGEAVRIDEEQAQWPFHVEKWNDVGAQLGGPIMKDKI